jgi:OmpA-OmpF porin, OOP family
MRLRAIVFACAALGAAGFGSWELARRAVAHLETTTEAELSETLAAAGEGWAGVVVDGLTVRLSGAAPDEAARFHAIEIARRVVAARRVEDGIAVRAASPAAPPAFKLELLRNADEVQLVGLVPEAEARDAIAAALDRAGLSPGAADMLETAAHPAPEGWEASLAFGLAALAELPRSKISIVPGRVEVDAVADSAEAQARLERRLRDAAPAAVDLALAVSAPRPAIAPFRLSYAFWGGDGRFAACTAGDEAAARQIAAAAGQASVDCRLGLGAPSGDWAKAAALGIRAVRELGGGRFELTDIDAVLTVPSGVDPEKLTAVRDDLEADMPEVYSLSLQALSADEATSAQADSGREPGFRAILLDDGSVRLAGLLRDRLSQTAAISYAEALFGHDRVMNTTLLDPDLPEGWPQRVLAGMEALSLLAVGELVVTADRVNVTGTGSFEQAAGEVAALLDARDVGPADVSVRHDVSLAAAPVAPPPVPELELAAMPAAPVEPAPPDPEPCALRVRDIVAEEAILFAPGAAEIEEESQGVVGRIAEALGECPGTSFEIAGHTDSQGSREMNLELSQARAEAVLTALEAAGAGEITLSARGYGPDEPVADNATGEGRARNRRIEFQPVRPGSEPEPSDVVAACADEIGAILAEEAILFGPGSDEMEPESTDVVDRIAAVLANCQDATFEIAGHTDAQGSRELNLELSQRRAEAVQAALEAQDLDVRLTARGYGPDEPVAGNGTADGRARNRRIEFRLLDSGQPLAEAARTVAEPSIGPR